jgi:glycosyltransferase involved in cell wall biosynthesis
MISDPKTTWREREEAFRSQQYVIDHLEPVCDGPAWETNGLDDPVAPVPVRTASMADHMAAGGSTASALGRVGLIGWNTATGVGYMNRDLAAHLPIAKWLAPRHPVYPTLDRPPTRTRVDSVRLDLPHAEIKAWLRGLDWILFVEHPYMGPLVHSARELGVRIACVPMWELADLNADWLGLCDMMICPSHFAYDVLSDWKHRFGFQWSVAKVLWPVDTDRFGFRPRGSCDRFLFINGTGGSRAYRRDGTLARFRRKGMDILLAAARRLRPIPFLVYSQETPTVPIPDNIELRRAPAQNRLLYAQGDVCVQPSRWEGLGLQMLECQAAGLPLVTTDAPPMNQYRPLRVVPARDTEMVTILGRHALTAHHVAPEDLADSLAALYQTDITEASESARWFIEQEHSWEKALPCLIRAFSG